MNDHQNVNRIIIQNICGLANSINTSGGLIFIGLEQRIQAVSANC